MSIKIIIPFVDNEKNLLKNIYTKIINTKVTRKKNINEQMSKILNQKIIRKNSSNTSLNIEK